MNKFSIESISAAAALTAMLAFSAHAQVGLGADVGVRTGVNSNIGSDVRANASASVSGSTYTSGMATRNNTSVDANTGASANGQASGGGVRGAVGRTANRAENAMVRGAHATSRAAGRSMDAEGYVARRADARIQNALPESARGQWPHECSGLRRCGR
ncbi:hypothetical protein [Polaromonas sp.]|uniref:hypothetical protein n=1 Tax=Polaromonas sp. TaxID=1869339 RepID=UPI00356462FF